MQNFTFKIEVLAFVVVLSFIHQLEGSRIKRHNGFLLDKSEDAEKCTTRNGGKKGVCMELDNCDEVINRIVISPPREQARFLQQRFCKFKENTNIKLFCCVIKDLTPSTTTTTTTTTTKPSTTLGPAATSMTESELNKICGTTNMAGKFIVGGSEAPFKAFPWMAAIFIGPSPSSVSCGGVLISEQYVLTAAHCIIDIDTGQRKKKSDFIIRLGTLDINGKEDEARPMDLSAAQLIPHEHYEASAFKNDIALIKLNGSVSFTDLIRPICLPSSPRLGNKLYVGERCYVAGWGAEQFGGKTSSVLRFVMLIVTTNSECETAYNGFRLAIEDTHLCAGISGGGKDACEFCKNRVIRVDL